MLTVPGSYAHYTLGCRCLDGLPDRLRERLLKNGDMFFSGLHGPDIFFYYRPMLPNRIAKSGQVIHGEDPKEFIACGKYLIRHTKSREIREKKFAYLCGFLCHYYLDSICHSFISRRSRYFSFYHYRIERAFDIRLMSLYGSCNAAYPHNYHDLPDMRGCAVIAGFYPEVTPKQIRSAVRGHRLYCSVNSFIERVTGLHSRENRRIAADTDELEALFEISLKRSIKGIISLEKYIFSDMPVSLRFKRNFKGRPT